MQCIIMEKHSNQINTPSWSEATFVKIPYFWKSHVAAYIMIQITTMFGKTLKGLYFEQISVTKFSARSMQCIIELFGYCKGGTS